MTPRPLPKKLYKQEGEIMPITCWPWMDVAGSFALNANGERGAFGDLHAFFQKTYGVLYWDFEALQHLARLYYQQYGTQEGYQTQYAAYLAHAQAIETLYHKTFDPSVFADTTTARETFQQLRTAYHAFWDSSLFIDAFDTGVDQEEIKKIAEQHGLNKEEVQVLSTPSEMTFADERKQAFLELLQKIQISPEMLDSLLITHKDILTSYRQQFDYVQANYARLKPITDQEILDEARIYAGDSHRLQQDLAELRAYTTTKEASIRAITKTHGLKENPLWFFNALTAWREHRKKINLMGFHVIEAYLVHLEKQTGIANRLLRFLAMHEIDQVLDGSLTADTLKHRYEEGVVIRVTSEDATLFEGAEAQSLNADLEQAFAGAAAQDILYGRTASQGYAKGIARVILAEADFPSFQEGEILVTSMTRPEFVPLMKKALAIITNEGGITCHAAIVSRELGKPCVIGTQTATQAINDGDLVEVRANHGTVRILRRTAA
ncbi:MAG: hypothetical protein RL141_844 [Candidatus Parcubacteria bacterium]|jgi:phosphohistidine swiveling domain-containing protein